MPNWVQNTLKCYVVRDREEFLSAVGAEHQVLVHDFSTRPEITTRYETCRESFCFWNVIAPEGEELQKYEDSIRDPQVLYDREWWGGLMPPPPYWYGWNVSNWGTKWDASDVEVNSGFIVEVTFNTAWSPPINAIQALARKFPRDEFHLRYVEEQGWGGYWRFKGDISHKDVTWEIPSSHEQAVLLEGYCMCFDSAIDADMDEFPYEDCPKPFAVSVAEAS